MAKDVANPDYDDALSEIFQDLIEMRKRLDRLEKEVEKLKVKK